MRYMGKLAGVIIALLMSTGLWGAVLGLLLGHAFDKTRRRASGYFSLRQRQILILTTTFEVMGHLAKSKGRVTQANINTAGMIMTRMNLNGDSRLTAQNAFRAGKSSHYPLQSKIHQLRRACFNRYDLIRMFLEIQIEAAYANGVLQPCEQRLLYFISDELGVSRRQFEHCLQSRRWFHGQYQQHRHHSRPDTQPDAAAKLSAACKVLGVMPNNDPTTIKRAYRKLMSQHHPDKLVARGLPPVMMQLAKQKAQKIQQAYDVIKLAKGFK